MQPDTDKFYYTQPNGKHRIHVTQHPTRYTLCYRPVDQDISEDRPQGEMCQQCEAVMKAMQTGGGIPF